jgi:transposase-like protein
MLHRLRLALKTKNWEKMGGPDSGPIEADETFVGGEPKNRHGHDPKKKAKYVRDGEGKWALNPNYAPQSGRATKKTPVFGLIDRETRQVRAKVIPNVDRHVLQEAILENVTKGSRVYTDSLNSYNRLTALEYVHKSVNHAVEYVREDIHTNSLENFWALLKRGLKGTYVCVEAFHLDRYINEQSFRYNNRATKENPLTDLDRFVFALSQISGKRLTYKELTGKEAGPEQPF